MVNSLMFHPWHLILVPENIFETQPKFHLQYIYFVVIGNVIGKMDN